jgi:uncharacterized protein YehS (DUF1456 family)
MNNNDIIRRIRYTFDFTDKRMMQLFELGGKVVTREELSAWLKKDDDEALKPIYDIDLAIFLNGLIIKRRGKKDGEMPKPEKSLNNNLVLRKLKIALNLRDEDILEILLLADLKVGKHELSAFFRKPGQSQYRPLKDQILRNFLHGMEIKYEKEREKARPEKNNED